MHAVLSALADPIADDMREVVHVFEDELRSDQPFVGELCARIARYRGKMLRPTLLLLTGRACGRVTREHHVLGAVVEMVHMATLVHDDVLDEADIRRGGPTINRLHGNEAAVLLGDYLISHAYHLCSSLDSQIAARRIAETTNTVCEGELMQVSQRGNWSLREDEYFEIIRRKTAVLTSVCCELGARFADADEETAQHAAAYGHDLGMAFQIIDDVLDLTSTEEEAGKSLGRDAALGKLTLPLIHALRSSGEDRRARLIESLTSGDGNGRGTRLYPVELSASIEHASSVARSYVQSAIEHLSDWPPSEARDALTAAAEFVVHRRA
ncbi:MAG: polyprenyl synthetase family protein [Phycisphaerae bacterium]|nr:polyprenyl synthetase family protein [Phycisphaerae bacterium]